MRRENGRSEEFKYLRKVLCKHGEMEGEIESALKGRCVMGSLASIMKERNVSVE